MPYDSELKLQITPAQQQAILAAIENLENVLDDIGAITIQPKQVKKLQLIGNKRQYYVKQCVKELVPNNPQLNNLVISAQRANDLFDSFMFLKSVQTRFKNLSLRISSTNYNAQHLLFEFATLTYSNAKRYKHLSVETEQAAKFLFELFGRHGNRKNIAKPKEEKP